MIQKYIRLNKHYLIKIFLRPVIHFCLTGFLFTRPQTDLNDDLDV
jgi:hypothetical protein